MGTVVVKDGSLSPAPMGHPPGAGLALPRLPPVPQSQAPFRLCQCWEGRDGFCPTVWGAGKQDKSRRGGKMRAPRPAKAPQGVGAALPAPQHRFN